jgi:hypothetical protein
MTSDTQSFKEKLILRITLARIADVFKSCEDLPQLEKQLAYEEIDQRMRALMPRPVGEPDPSAQSFIDRCRELAASAPNVKVQKALLMIASVCEADPSSNEKSDS